MSERNLSVLLTANTTSLKSQLAIASREVKQFGNEVEKTGNGVASKSGLMGRAVGAAGLVVAAGFAYAVAQAMKFETQMRNVNSISKLSEQQLASLSQVVVDLSRVVPQSASTLAAGLYDIASSGFYGAEGVRVLEAASLAASAGMSDTATAARAITGVLNAYGLEAADAGYVSDVLFQTVNLGVVTFDQLAGSLGDVIGVAAAASVDIADVSSAIATMTLAGLGAAEGSTSLNRLLQAMLQPSEALAELYKKVGIESGSMGLKQLGLFGVMEKVRDATGGNIDAMLKLFPEIRAVRGALALLADEGGNYARVQAEIANREKVAGATRAAFTEQTKAAGAQMQLLTNNINAAAIALGTALLPPLVDALNWFQKMTTEGVQFLGDAFDAVRPVAESFGKALGSLVDIGATMYQAIFPLVKVTGMLVGAFTVGALYAFAKGLELVTGWLQKNPAIVKIAALALAGYATAATIARIQTIALTETKIAVWAVDSMIAVRLLVSELMLMIALNGGGLAGLTRSLGQGLKAALMSPIAPAIALVAGIALIYKSMQNSKEEAQKLAKALSASFDPRVATSMIGEINKVGAAADEALAKLNQKSGSPWEWLKGEADILIGGIIDIDNSLLDQAELVRALNNEYEGMADVAGNALQGVQSAFKQAHPEIRGMLQDMDLTDKRLRVILGVARAEGIDLSKPWEQWAGTLADAYIATTQMTPAQAALSESLKTVSDEASTGKEKMEAYKGAMDAIIGVVLNSFDANTKWAGSLADLRNTLTENGTTLDENTDKGRKNRSALSDSAKGALDHAAAIANETGSIEKGNEVLGQHALQMYGVLTSMGLTDAQAQLYLATLGLTPENLSTLISLEGTETAALTLEQLQAQVNALEQPRFINVQAGAYLLDLDTTLEGIQTRATSLDGTPWTLTVAANVQDANAELEGFQTLVMGLDGKPHEVTINADVVDADANLLGIQQKVMGLDGVVTTITVSVPEINDVNTSLEGTQFYVTDLNGKQAVVTLAQEGWEDLDPKLAGVQVKVADINGKPVTVTLGYDKAGKNDIYNTFGTIEDLKGRAKEKVTIPVSVKDKEAQDKLNGLVAKAAELDNLNPTVDVTVKYTVKGQVPVLSNAAGGVVHFFAAGGVRNESHIAQIAPAGAMRIWAEPETGGEAYIPLAASKRDRSEAILTDVARRFGYGRGGAAPPTQRTVNMSFDGSVVVQGNADGATVAQLQTVLDERNREAARMLRTRVGV